MDLYAPTGEKYATDDPTEITRLKATHGYSETKPKPAEAKEAAAEKPKN